MQGMHQARRRTSMGHGAAKRLLELRKQSGGYDEQ